VSATGTARVWDLPVRVVHWAIVLLVAGLWATGDIGGFDVNLPLPGGGSLFVSNMELHGWLGQGVLGLVIFRLLWGVMGSNTARFASFVRGPRAVAAYLGALLRGRLPPAFGHNPGGALMILLMLALLATQAILGLFASDDFLFEGPLAHLVGSELSARITHWHRSLFNLLLAATGLHVAAALYYALRGKNLIRAMITGRQRRDALPPEGSLQAAPAWRFLLAAAIAVATVYCLNRL
jgi:cytochrome b